MPDNHSAGTSEVSAANKRVSQARRVLLVDDSRAICSLLQSQIDAMGAISADVAENFAQAKELLNSRQEDYFVAVLDLHLPDAPDGEVVDHVLELGIPVIVLTGMVDDSLRESMFKKHIADYVVKNSLVGIDHILRLVQRIHKARELRILVVDDSRSYREYLRALLSTRGYNTIEAEDGEQGLALFKSHNDIRLVITDYNMPKMDGLRMVAEIRKTHSADELAIIAMSSTQDNRGLVAHFLKAGASDFLNKSFEFEEFYCRVDQNLDMIRHVQEARDLANRDFLTRLYNRRYFFEHAEKLYRRARDGEFRIAAGMIDADHFKKINDTYGHAAGDDALVAIASAMSNSIGAGSLIARYGGEEFVCLQILNDGNTVFDCMEELRKAIASIHLEYGGKHIPLTASVGATSTLSDNLDHMLAIADNGVYRAKQQGRNQVVVV